MWHCVATLVSPLPLNAFWQALGEHMREVLTAWLTAHPAQENAEPAHAVCKMRCPEQQRPQYKQGSYPSDSRGNAFPDSTHWTGKQASCALTQSQPTHGTLVLCQQSGGSNPAIAFGLLCSAKQAMEGLRWVLALFRGLVISDRLSRQLLKIPVSPQNCS